MRRIKPSRQLVLDRVTLRLLTPMQLGRVAGGQLEDTHEVQKHTKEEDCAFDDTLQSTVNRHNTSIGTV